MGLANSPIAIPKNIIVSEILSNVESIKAPFLDVVLVILATLPSTTSKNPPANNKRLPMAEKFIVGSNFKVLIPKIIEEIIVITNPIKENVFGDNPVDENKSPIFSKIGCKRFLNLFSTYSDR
jgi:hypothetical protein